VLFDSHVILRHYNTHFQFRLHLVYKKKKKKNNKKTLEHTLKRISRFRIRLIIMFIFDSMIELQENYKICSQITILWMIYTHLIEITLGYISILSQQSANLKIKRLVITTYLCL
jgi:hypothetical protein